MSTTITPSTWLIGFILMIYLPMNFSCSKDVETLRSSVIQEDVVTVQEVDTTGTSEEEVEDTPLTKEETDEERTPVVDEESYSCETNGGFASDRGLKTWCWADVTAAIGGPNNYSFSEGQLSVSAECNQYQVTNVQDRLRFNLDLTQPAADWCSNDFNLRAEISTSPWKVNHSAGTEEWFGWTYTFGDDYIIDKVNPWAFFQVHEGTSGKTPMIALWCTNEGGPGSGVAGEITISNTTGGNTYGPTGVVPTAGQELDIVVHVIWGDENNGLLQVWIDGSKVHDEQRRTIHAFNPVGGNAKFGIYKWGWRDQAGIDSAMQQGINHLETFMGPLRIITRLPSDEDYGKDSYSEVVPR